MTVSTCDIDAAGLTTRSDYRGKFTMLSKISYQRDRPMEVMHHIEVGSQMRCTDTAYTSLTAQAAYTVVRIWGGMDKQRSAFIEVADKNGDSMGEYGLWRFIPVDPAIEAAAEEYEDILKETQVMNALQA